MGHHKRETSKQLQGSFSAPNNATLDKPLFRTKTKTTREENNNASRKKKSDDTRKNIAICSVNVFQFHFSPR
jgi:hypothetical protein